MWYTKDMINKRRIILPILLAVFVGLVSWRNPEWTLPFAGGLIIGIVFMTIEWAFTWIDNDSVRITGHPAYRGQ